MGCMNEPTEEVVHVSRTPAEIGGEVRQVLSDLAADLLHLMGTRVDRYTRGYLMSVIEEADKPWDLDVAEVSERVPSQPRRG